MRTHAQIMATALVLGGCASTPKEVSTPADVAPTKEQPPAAQEPKSISAPDVNVTTLANGLEVRAIVSDQLPIVYAQLVVLSGAETDPQKLPGLADLTATMLKEGTKKRTGLELADEIEFLGADLWTGADEESTQVGVRALSEHFDDAMALLAEVAREPTFDRKELDKLKRREADRLALAEQQPQYIARRSYYQALYGKHPYSRVDTTPAALKRLNRRDLMRWHRKHFVAKNAFLVVVGDIAPEKVAETAGRVFGSWRSGARITPNYPAPPTRAEREIIVVDRPGSVQSVIYIGNLAIQRSHPDWIPLLVANQVLGGSAASRLFMDLREKRSLTYGAYSGVSERSQIGPFTAYASVRTEVTLEAMSAFFEHLDRIIAEPARDAELANAIRYLGDSFPLKIDTPGKVAELVVEQQLYGLPDGYWEAFRKNLGAVQADDALTAAKAHIRPDQALIVVVGQAADFAQALRQYGPVRVFAPDGELKAQFAKADPAESGTPAE